MLRLITGRAGAGKTGRIIDEIKNAVAARQGGYILIVPEQYSHEAERELAHVCGDSLSLYAEVFSFTGLARRVAALQGGAAGSCLDKGGRLLCMALALSETASRLRVYSAARYRPELQSMLLSAVDELKSACIGAEALYTAAHSCPDGLGDKLRDLALVAEAYDAVVANGRADPTARLDLLVSQLADSAFDERSRIYVDGFTDFTGQQLRVLQALLDKKVTLTVCLTLDELYGDNEIYELSRRAARQLSTYARERGSAVEHKHIECDRPGPTDFFADNLFSYSSERYPQKTNALRLYSASGMREECELAAARALELVQTGECRWRDIAVAVRGFGDYQSTLESVFEHYCVPLYTAKKSSLLSKPLPSVIAGAYEVIQGGWQPEDVLTYLGTGLTGQSESERDELANYIYKWQPKASAWRRTGDWRQHPDGYGCEYDERANARLDEINRLRRQLAKPLLAFAKASEKAETACAQASALAALLEQLKLPETMQSKADMLAALGRETLAAEYRQLWELLVSAIEQCDAILGAAPMNTETFSRLFALMLSQYDVGTIPVSLDRVCAGDFDRMRRRNIKHLIVLGASDKRLPGGQESAGVFSQDERQRLLELDIDLGGAGDSELWREFSVIYNCLSLPSESLTLSYPLSDADGARQRPAFVINRAAALFGLEIKPAEPGELKGWAQGPALSLAAEALRGGGRAEQAAAQYFSLAQPERFRALAEAASATRGSLSPEGVNALYGKRLRLSATRIEQFASCQFAYFCKFGLLAKTSEPADFRPPEVGSFMHFVLEGTAKDVKNEGGFAKVSRERLHAITKKHVDAYIKTELNDFGEKSERFVYLFRRLCADVQRVVDDMADELRSSDFEPLSFELDFAAAQELPPIELGEGEDRLTITGVADRVDGWVHDGKLYLRVVDYKTGKKKFSLSDVWYGMGLQLLLYLFALQRDGETLYGREIVPAGVIYLPARSTLLSSPTNLSDEEAAQLRGEELRRSGLVLEQAELLEAWERGKDKKYIPVKFKNGSPTGDAVASMAHMGTLAGHIKKSLTGMARQLHRGSIAADPFYRSQQENACLTCEYFDACHFSDGENGESSRYIPKLSTERVWALMEGEKHGEV